MGKSYAFNAHKNTKPNRNSFFPTVSLVVSQIMVTNIITAVSIGVDFLI